ncbi:MAG: basic amino acid ABC transporter substrate-binding protein [Desulfatibacillaceae bacterium]
MKKLALIAVIVMLLAGSAMAEEKTLVFATDATWPPMEFIDENKNITGYSVEYMTAAAEAAGFKAEFKAVAWDGIFAGLGAGKYDAICSSVSITEERMKAMDFSQPYYKVQQAIIVRKDTDYKTLDDLKGKKVGSQISTTGTFAVEAAEGVESKTYDEVGLAVEDLYNGRLEAVVCDDPVAADYALNNPKYKKTLTISSVIEAGDVEYYGIAVKQGNKDVLYLINQGITAVKVKGIDKKLEKKWIGK